MSPSNTLLSSAYSLIDFIKILDLDDFSSNFLDTSTGIPIWSHRIKLDLPLICPQTLKLTLRKGKLLI